MAISKLYGAAMTSCPISSLQAKLDQHGLLPKAVEEAPEEHVGQALSQSNEARRAQWEAEIQPHWGAVVEGWLSAPLRAAAKQSTSPEPVAAAWADSLAPSFANTIEVVTGLSLPQFLVGWVEIASNRRHGTLPMPESALLSSFIAASDDSVESPPSLRVWFEDLRQSCIRADALEDRRQACLRADDIERELVRALESSVASRAKELLNIRRVSNGIVACLPGALATHEFVANSAHVWLAHGGGLKQLSPGQAFPSLALTVFQGLSKTLRADDEGEQKNLKQWVLDGLNLALPQLLEHPLDTAEVLRQVRESIRYGAHAVSLAPSPRLRPAISGEDGFLSSSR